MRARRVCDTASVFPPYKQARTLAILIEIRGGQVGQEIIAQHETHKDKVVDQPLHVRRGWGVRCSIGVRRGTLPLPLNVPQAKFKRHVLPKEPNVQELKLVCLLEGGLAVAHVV